jgi:cell division protein ZapA
MDQKQSGDPADAAPSPNQGTISVDIYDQTYHLRGQDAEYVRRLAAMVDDKMRAVAAHGKTVDSLRVAVLAALNIADELAAFEASYSDLTHDSGEKSLRTRARSLSGLIDAVLEDERRIG